MELGGTRVIVGGGYSEILWYVRNSVVERVPGEMGVRFLRGVSGIRGPSYLL